MVWMFGEGGNVFPTGVGVNRIMRLHWEDMACIPHRRGGEPKRITDLLSYGKYSPQAWG